MLVSRRAGMVTALATLCTVLCVVMFEYVSPFFTPKPQTYIVTHTARGFSPERLTIKRGDTVIFKNETGQPDWPASDYHPTHLLYPEFDPKQPVAATSTWSFTFQKVGVWGYHDHLHPSAHATITVVGAPGEEVQTCLQTQGAQTIQPECWGADISKTLSTRGLDAAFDEVRKWYDQSPDFQRNCHDVMHILGASAYGIFEKNAEVITRPEVSYCGWGFYHGFIEAMLTEKGSSQYGDAVAYCSAIKSLPGDAAHGAGPCYHGVGHAVFDSLDSSLWGDDMKMAQAGIKTCEAVFQDEYPQAGCTSGVFNALTNAKSARTYGLTFSAADPIPVCRFVRADYKRFCYMELGNGYIRSKDMPHAESLAFIEALPSLLEREAVITGYMDTEVRRSIDTATSVYFATMCKSFSGESEQEACVNGVIVGLTGEGEPGNESPRVKDFCASLSGATLQTFCFKQVE